MGRPKLPPKHLREYKESENREQVLQEAYDFARFTLESKEIPTKYKRKLLDGILWDITEVDEKYAIRYRSKIVLEKDECEVNHEHVITKEFLIDKLLEFPEMYKEILDMAIACVVTRDEHKYKLNKINDVEGWERYKRAKINVIDMTTGKEVNLDELIALQKPMLDKLNGK